MTHLTKAEPRGLFNTTVPERPNRETGHDTRPFLNAAPIVEPPFAVAIDTTPDEARRLRMGNFPEYTWPSVRNVNPRHRGKHY